MTQAAPSPLTAPQLVDEYFIENRNRVLELAAFLDRLDRAGTAAREDFRIRAMGDAIAALSGVSGSRVTHIQMLFSDPTIEPRATLDRKGAVGAYDAGRR
jgi:hypothetical protein